MTITPQTGARMCWLVDAAFDMAVTNPGNLAPPFDARLSGAWRLLGHIVGRDCLFGAGPSALGQDVCYGFLAQSLADPGQFVAVVRGTATLLEWVLDAEFLPSWFLPPADHPVAGKVEIGFWRVYTEFRYAPVGGVQLPAALGLAEAVGAGNLLVVGHSLGAADASYLAFDVAGFLGERASACLIASPRPGDAVFAKAFDERLSGRYALWNYELDVVPRVPRGPDYTDLPGVNWIGIESALAHIRFSLPCHHNILSYAAMLAGPTTDWPLLSVDKSDCIKGPRISPAAAIRAPAIQTGSSQSP